MIQCEYCRKIFPKRYLKLHIRFEHRTSVAYMKYTCNVKDCNRSFSNYKCLLQHMRRCKHLKTVIFESNILNNVNDTSQLNFCNEKTESDDTNINDINDINTDTDVNNINTDTDVNKNCDIEGIRNELSILALELVSSLHADAILSRVQIDHITRIFNSFLNNSYMNDIKRRIALMESLDSDYILE